MNDVSQYKKRIGTKFNKHLSKEYIYDYFIRVYSKKWENILPFYQNVQKEGISKIILQTNIIQNLIT